MCKGCWIGDHGMPILNSAEVLVTAELIRRLYEDLGCPTGGPLHAMLDDMNIDDEQVENEDVDKACAYLFDGSFERWAQAGDDTSDECKNAIKEACELILHSFRQMPESHRAAAIAWFKEWIPEGIEPRKATPEEVAELVAEWTREMAIPESESNGQKACVSIPCPPFSEVTLPIDPAVQYQLVDSSGQPVKTYEQAMASIFAPDAQPDGLVSVSLPISAVPGPDGAVFSRAEALGDSRQVRPVYSEQSKDTLLTSKTSPLLADIKARILDVELRKAGMDPDRYELAYEDYGDFPVTISGPTASPGRDAAIRELGEALDVPQELLAGLAQDTNRIEPD